MSRYFIEVAYKGTNYSGFQIQQNANSIQSEIERSLSIFFRQSFNLTGASRTDAGVHALQNYFHFDKAALDQIIPAILPDKNVFSDAIYHLNAILPTDICIKNIFEVNNAAHCRYDAIEREYKYYIYKKKDPFLKDRAYFFPYKLNIDALQAGAHIIKHHRDFTSFSKRSTQVKNFLCEINISKWSHEDNVLIYTVSANRFLRGMVRGLVASMLKLARELINEDQFKDIFTAYNCAAADFSAPAHGLFLKHIKYPDSIFEYPVLHNKVSF